MASSANTQLVSGRVRICQQGTNQEHFMVELQFEKDSQNEIVLFADRRKGLILTFDLAKVGLWSIEARLWSNILSVRAALQSLTNNNR